MSDKEKHQDKFDKRAANLRANLQRRKAQTRKIKDTEKENQDSEKD